MTNKNKSKLKSKKQIKLKTRKLNVKKSYKKNSKKIGGNNNNSDNKPKPIVKVKVEKYEDKLEVCCPNNEELNCKKECVKCRICGAVSGTAKIITHYYGCIYNQWTPDNEA